MSDLETDVQRLIDERDIRDLVARFANACSPPNPEAFARLWLPNAVNHPVWTLSEPFATIATGNADIVALLLKLLAPWDFFVQLVHSGVVDINGHRATGRFIIREVAKGPDETYYNNFAIYEDEYLKIDGTWYFGRRDYKYMFLDSGPFAGAICSPIAGWFGKN
ncbi:uncharacterized protein HMPREF1541_07127 [Cyphellophora europaea CBS 101466]|uniref:SnoaL-like domain-containing protein n=1 Tax=Cyphellophora europaea (strain CBS 101466) TaxID=1220924 RepID=W2RMG0_CYPE1|nr:uncharacterized protein HMPREF1541_07127 [Cyphellophora europaea CBS 101466]ETN37505.1 hypothetical protein HMPREF1541_07127 [Cyphellophora europaea CBS 101466]